jgi:hypothetical protein
MDARCNYLKDVHIRVFTQVKVALIEVLSEPLILVLVSEVKAGEVECSSNPDFLQFILYRTFIEVNENVLILSLKHKGRE